MEKGPVAVFIFGPTGVGKTEFVDCLASRIPAEIVNMDMGQFYEPLSIGTAKPDWRSSSIPHHLFDILAQPCNFTVVDYRKRLQEALAAIHARNRVALIVGGSAFYLTSLFFPPTQLVAMSSKVDQIEDESLWQRLYTIDPQRAEHIKPNDYYRLRRALSIWYTTGIKPSCCNPQFSPLCPFIILSITRDRQDLYERINNRVLSMMQQGWLEEVKGLRGSAWEEFLRTKKIIGYPELLAYLDDSTQSLEDVIRTIQQKTRCYAKRQYTFWRRLERLLTQVTQNREYIHGIYELNLTHSDYELYIRQLLPLLKE